ncbi:hypothetical protein [Sediminitomix flava]|uniref:hypothetical protein n=1 Tax=Sediminitomix flava TaxID=379075 RepID=UPI000D6CE606|nr:hypothetical protein [Sediminitomix flava]
MKPIFEKYILNRLPNDKHLHFLYGLIIVLLPFWTAWFGLAVCICLSVIKEIYDYYKDNGCFDIYDILVSVGAGGLGVLLRIWA